MKTVHFKDELFYIRLTRWTSWNSKYTLLCLANRL